MPTRDEMASHAAIQAIPRRLASIERTLDRYVLLYEWQQLKSVGPLGDREEEAVRERQLLRLEEQLWPSDG